jgi:outer membrane protein assembly factor BamA
VNGYTNVNLSYLNRNRRLGWGGAVFDQRTYYYAVDSATGALVRLENHNSGALAFAEYPFSRFLRADLGVGYYNRTNQQFAGIGFDPLSGFFSLGDSVHSSGPFVNGGLSFDSARFGAPAWAIQGLKIDLGLEKGFSGGGYTDTDVAVRKYQHIVGRSLLAWRTVYHESRGPGLTYTSLGGYNTLRGYNYAEFFGSRQFFTNLEFRLPLIDHLVLPWLGGLDLRGIRLAIFVDAGAAWIRAQDLKVNQTGVDGNLFIDPERDAAGCAGTGPAPLSPPTLACNVHEYRFWAPGQVGKRLQDGRASYGFDWSFFLGPLELHWDYTRRWDFRQSGPGFGTDFYIGYTW